MLRLFAIALLPILWALSQTAAAAPPEFEVIAIDETNECGTAAAVDVNGDGKLDILCGHHWYAAPDWHRHFARDVQVIRGRLDDYSN